VGENALLLVFTGQHDKAPALPVQQRLWHLAAWLQEMRAPFNLVEIIPGMGNLLVSWKPAPSNRSNAEMLREEILQQWAHLPAKDAPGRVVEIPVSYGGDAGPDLDELAIRCGLARAELITRHSEAEYRVFCLGFQPGFAYLSGLDPQLHTPRRETPRLHVPAGSVAIGGSQTGIYPSPTPGGWHIIGHTHVRLFDPTKKQASLLKPGDTVRFIPEEAMT
jgi:KipI family sensor histidine kinase inhibitor